MEEHFSTEVERAYTTRTQQDRASVEARLESLSELQDQLASARRQLLVTRERVRTASRNVRLKRVDAGDAEVIFMNRLRQFVNQPRDGLPDTIIDAYNAVAQARDILGEIEEDYLQAERNLTGAEWRFMDQENGFYQFDIWSIVNEDDPKGIAASQDQTHDLPLHLSTPQLQPFLPDPGSTTHSAGWLDAGDSSETPHPTRSPSLRSAVSTLDVAVPLIPASEVYFAKLAEVERLRQGFDRIRQNNASNIVWQEGGEVLFANGVEPSDLDPAAPTSDYFKILHQLSQCEASAQQLKVAAMTGVREAPALALARRYSDPVPDFAAAQPCSASMRRTQTESAVCIIKDDPTTKEKIREWSLTYLKSSAVQKCIYLNALEDREVANLTDDDWKARATRFWSNDSLVETGDGNERCATSTNGTSHEPVSCRDIDVVESAPSSSELRLPHGEEMHPSDRTNGSTKPLELGEMPQGDDSKASSMSPRPLSLSRHHRLDDTGKKTGCLIGSSNGRSPDIRQRNEGSIPADDVADRIRCTCPSEYSDAAKRKDSVQGTDVDHHHSCALAVRHSLGVHMQLPAQISRGLEETATKTSTNYEHCHLTQPRLPDVHASTPTDSDVTKPIRVQPTLDSETRTTLPSPRVHTPSAPTSDMRATPPFVESTITSNAQSPSGRRKSSSSWLGWLRVSKNKRSKSTPSIAMHRPGVHARKQSVA